MAAVTVENITKRYGDTVALDGVSFEVEPGELFGIIGPDGAGKTSLFRIIATLILADSGTATVLGFDVVKDYKELRKRIGYMPGRFSLYQDMTVEENLAFFASVFGTTIEANYHLVEGIYKFLEPFKKRRAGKLSGGMKQKLALACALIHRPKVLLLDEPTTGVDAVSRSEFWNMLTTLKEQGITILVSTSYMDEAERCGQIALMNKGRILDMNTPARLIEGMDKNLYNASAADMYPLLKALRALPDVEDCYTFGATLHVVARDNFNPDAAVAKLRRDGLADARIYPARGNIEDLFIKLAKHDEPDNDLEK